MLEDPNVCAICGAPVKGFAGGVPVYFCPSCYETYGPDILAQTEWVKYLLGAEKARRKRRNRLIHSVGLPVFIYGIPHQWEAGYAIRTRLYPYRRLELPVGG